MSDDDDDPIFEDEPGAALSVVGECPECGATILTAYGQPRTSCADHTPPYRYE